MRRGAVLLAVSLIALPMAAQQPSLEVQTADGRTTFHTGEPIVLNLTIATPVDGVYVAAPWKTPRGGEFDMDTIAVSPATGWSDPLALYFKQRMIRMGHGWQWPPLEKAKPAAIPMVLNDWVRFEQPGDYTVTVTTHRISGKTDEKERPTPSAAIRLHIEAARAEWQSARLEEIRLRLPVNDPLKFDEGALRELKYLGTPEAIDLLSRLMRNIGWYVEWEAAMGLDGLKDAMRPIALHAMDKRIAEADFPISPEFFSTYCFLQVRPGSEMESIEAQIGSSRAALWPKVFAAVASKEGKARAQTVQTLLFFGREIKTPEVQARMGSLLSSSFFDLDERSQIDDLRQHWDMLNSAEFVAVLRKLAEMPFENDDANVPYSSTDLRAAAFQRWHELDPAAARREALRQIGSSSPTMPAQAVAFLADKSLAEFEPTWAKAFVETTEQLTERRLGSLLVRFGTGAATPQMMAKLDAHTDAYPCDAHVYALAYLARFNPKEARPRLRHEVAADEGRCGGSLFQWISQQTAAPVLNDVAVENLANSSEEVVRGAIEYLTAYGRPEDKAPVLKRFEEWKPDWKNYPNYFNKALDKPPADPGNFIVGEELARAVTANQGWLADKALIDSVVARCAGEAMCSSLRGVQVSSGAPYQVRLPDTTEPMGFANPSGFGVAQYGPRTMELLDAKLQQFPRGTTFALQPLMGERNSDRERLEAKVRALFAKRGMVLKDTGK